MKPDIDAAKAFDQVHWPYLWDTLKIFGFPQNMVRAVQNLYYSPRARVLVNGELSDWLDITRGTRKGCPLSPLLFNLYIEPFASLIRADPTILPFNTAGLVAKLALYADNLILYTTNPEVAIPNLMAKAEAFGRISGYKVNSGKTEIMEWN